MIRSVAGKIMWVGRATVFLLGVAVILALVFGVASTAFAHGGNKGFFHLGHKNVTSKVSTLVRQGAGPALNLQVESGPPLKVNSATQVPNLNADQVDGKDSTEIGVNGLQVVSKISAYNSNSPKAMNVPCPSGKSPVGTGFHISGGTSGSAPNAQTDVVIDELRIIDRQVYVQAYEESLTSANWYVEAIAICATVP